MPESEAVEGSASVSPSVTLTPIMDSAWAIQRLASVAAGTPLISEA